MPTHAPKSLVTRPRSVSALLTYHACRCPMGRGPFQGCLCPSGYLMVARTTAFPRLMHRYSASRVSPCWYWECGLEATFLFYYDSFRVPRPEASTPLLCRLLPGHLLLRHPLWCRLVHGRSYPWVSGGGTHRVQVPLGPDPVNTRGWSMPEAGQTPEADSLSYLITPLIGPTKC